MSNLSLLIEFIVYFCQQLNDKQFINQNKKNEILFST
jgi:hypothetical protein